MDVWSGEIGPSGLIKLSDDFLVAMKIFQSCFITPHNGLITVQ